MTHTSEWYDCMYVRNAIASTVILYYNLRGHTCKLLRHLGIRTHTHKTSPICDSYAACDTAWTVYCVHIYESEKRGTKKKPSVDNKIAYLEPEKSQSTIYIWKYQRQRHKCSYGTVLKISIFFPATIKNLNRKIRTTSNDDPIFEMMATAHRIAHTRSTEYK